MSGIGTTRTRRAGVATAAALALLTTGAWQVGGTASAAGAPTEVAAPSAAPAVSLLRATRQTTAPLYDGRAYVELGVHVVAGDDPFEVRVTRPSYRDKLRATVSDAAAVRALPRGFVKEDFSGLRRFFRLTVVDRAGSTVVDRRLPFCPNSYAQVRRRVDAPSTSPYGYGCEANRYALGQVWGLQAGWATPALEGVSLPLQRGRYRATLSISPGWVSRLGLTDDTSATVRFTVVPSEDGEGEEMRRDHVGTSSATEKRDVRPSGSALRRLPETDAASATADGAVLSDLRSLPAWGIRMQGNQLQFSATVWNAGPSPLVVDAFRRGTDSDLMDAHQYFYDSDGRQVGHAPVGTMEWDARDGHHHWHFTDFASYRLLDADKRVVVRSRKEAFCLANTDAVDYTVPGANWRPDNTDLHTSCGDRGSVAVRQTLETGSGDTYAQFLPGQSFNVRNLPNGVYYIQVLANPEGALHESSTANNAALRRVALGGRPGKRTVRVSQVGVIKEPPVEDGFRRVR
ncbi:lysyl oxidase family protein [Nocardioides aequoreus]|uniref:lysyl oxidase family protein n=1 Tax=Nocardioides aequoreus TaxID=397278 RepID=UPI000A04B1FE|nr:lysyl oxidase family protein [Nocardioides aequoreus]